VKLVKKNVAEPYSWFVDNERLKKQALTASGFDTSAFTVDRGHTWENEKWDVKLPGMNFSSYTTASRVQGTVCTGLFPTWSGTPSPFKFNVPTSSLESWAATMFGRMAPSVSEFSLSNFLGELREGLPRFGTAFLSSKVKNYKALGDDYLNVEFGWKPFLSDLQSIAQALADASYGLFRPLGATHRSRTAQPIETLTRYDQSNARITWFGGGSSYQGGNLPSDQEIETPDWVSPTWARVSGDILQSEKITVQRSIEGEFVYIPKAGFDPSKYMDRLETLMSFDITPSVLWNLQPWTWLADWFVDIGGAISSMEGAMLNRVLTTYLYAMETTTVKHGYLLSKMHPTFTGEVYVGPTSYANTTYYVRKRRIRANPFGFNGSSDFVGLNSEQSAILGALGLTRSRVR
jgi:hypothetical protein